MAVTRSGATIWGRTILLCGIFALALTGCHIGSEGGASSSTASTNRSPSGSGSPPASIAISGTPTTQVGVGQPYSFTPTVQNSANSTVSFSIQHKPVWASFSIATGHLTGTPTSADVGTYENVVIDESNGASTVSLAPFTIIVSSGNAGTATLSWTAPTTNTNGTPITDLAGYRIEYGTTSSDLRQTVTIGSPSATSYTISNLSSGTWYFAIMAYSTDGTQSSLSNVVSKTVP